MIEIEDKSLCCGCMACVQKCPKSCIDIVEDEEGFKYPKVREAECIDCGLCESVCQFKDKNKEREPIEVFASKNLDEYERLASSSGGIFSVLANYIIERNGIVFGARFRGDFTVVHDYIEHKESLHYLRGSKYLQSDIISVYKQVEAFLKKGRLVLFTGTPCQILGLKKFLKNKEKGLLCVDILCHGVPSPKVWKEYMDQNQLNTSDEITFRDKKTGWKNYSITFKDKGKDLLSQIYRDNIFMKGFLYDLYLRPSCYNCIAKSGKSESDITIGDFWGSEEVCPGFDDDKGISLVIINTEKGKSFFEKLQCEKINVKYSQALKWNPAIIKPVGYSRKRQKFWDIFITKGVNQAVLMLAHPSFKLKIKKIIIKILSVLKIY